MNEDPLSTRFIELATRPLEDQPGVREEARGELMGRLAYSGPPGPALEAAAERLEKAKPGRWRGKVLAAAITGLLCAGVAAYHVALVSMEARSVVEMMAAFQSGAKVQVGPPEGEGEAPEDDPAAYEGYVKDLPDLPPDYRQTWERIDPGNGMWPAGAGLRKATQALDPSGAAVMDETAFTEALALLEEAANAERFHSYALGRTRRMLERMQRPGTLIGEAGLVSLAQISRFGHLSHGIRDPWHSLFSIQADRLEKANDREGLRKLIGVWEKLTARFIASVDQGYLLDAYAFGSPASDLAKAAGALGMTEEKERLDRQADGLLAAVSRGAVPPASSRRPMGMMARASVLFSDPAEDDSMYAPGRNAEYALLDQILALISLVLLFLALYLACFESIRRGRRVNGLASGLMPLFDWKDSFWISGLGAAFPLAWYLGITRLTPLGCRDIGLPYFPFPPAIIQAFAALLFAGVMLVQTIRWRITRRASFAALGSSRLVPGWLAAAIAGAVIPLTGAVRALSGNEDDYLLGMAISLGIPALWLLWHAGAILFSTKDSALRGVILARNMVAPLAALIIFLTASVAWLRASEIKWLARDEFTRCEPSLGGLTKLEWQVLEKKKAAFLKALEQP